MSKSNIKIITFACIFLFSIFHSFAQPYKSTVKTSRDPWRFGFRLSGSYDVVSLQQGVDYVFGWKAGVTAEKRLVYNLYFCPSISVVNKGYRYVLPYKERGVINGYFIEVVTPIQLNFGDQRSQKGLYLSVAPYATYGITGVSEYENLRSNQLYKEKTFDEGNLIKFDLGFQLGLGYDFNKHLQLGGYYYFGLQRIMEYTNYKWRGFHLQMTYFL